MADNLRVTIAVTGLRDVGGHRAGLVTDDIGSPQTVNLNAYTTRDVVREIHKALSSAVAARLKMAAAYSRVTVTVVVE